jgi:ribosomal protein S18 acetylase RimI-like enzyme
MIAVADSQDIRYGLLDSNDIEEMAELLADVFSRFDPPALAVGLLSDEVRELVRLFGRRAPGDGLTIIARSQSSGRLVGAMLTDDFSNPPPEGIDKAAMKFDPIAALLEDVDQQYRKLNAVKPGETLHLFMLGVAAGFGGKGIAQTLVRLTLENGLRKGYKVAVTEATGNISQHVFRNLGFAERFRTPYRQFTYCGKRTFESIVGHEALLLMERILDPPR